MINISCILHTMLSTMMEGWELWTVSIEKLPAFSLHDGSLPAKEDDARQYDVPGEPPAVCGEDGSLLLRHHVLIPTATIVLLHCQTGENRWDRKKNIGEEPYTLRGGLLLCLGGEPVRPWNMPRVVMRTGVLPAVYGDVWSLPSSYDRKENCYFTAC